MPEDKKDNKVKNASQVIKEISKDELNEEELTEEEKVALKYIKQKIKDLEQFGEFAKVIHFYHQYYGLGKINIDLPKTLSNTFETNEDSFTIFDKEITTALTFNLKEKREYIAYRIALKYLKPLSKFLDNLLINIHFNREAIKEVLQKYIPEDKLNIVINQIKQKLQFPISISSESSDDIIMLIAPRVIE